MTSMLLQGKNLPIISIIFIGFLIITSSVLIFDEGSLQSEDPIRYVFEFEGIEREYFVWPPKDIADDQTYWPLVVAHGGGSNGRNFWLAHDLVDAATAIGLNVFIISPSFLKDDPNLQRFPVLGEGAFFRTMIEEVKTRYPLKSKILLTGYSRGAQFTHRFALQNPDLVEACAPLAAGAWTTPDGRFLMYTLGEIADPETFLSSPKNGDGLKAAQQNLFNPQDAKVASQPASPSAQDIPFLVMCGSLDERIDVSKTFARSLEDLNYKIRRSWPNTPHGGRNKEAYRDEFKKFSQTTLRFFLEITESTK